ncbi:MULTISPECIES: DUF2946 family protein [Pseudomonas]|uniref:DUF2946 domain-containing protein n=1 Tax=Pseudomonas neustonica TaxID=2487346 RepID=A0ABX9XHP5_9PSED|nr:MULTISPECIES: DUF2946 family protein [Pseudomonas]MAB25903.1 hypothetical protein [Pseudomonadales bacterium]MBA6421562.1 DUF2946 domain-containing protein [Pseudomonas sp. 5Ae-yellow]ROZ80763.1 DUF2946 domain-containing protein [Pseudomonas sp. SSM44]ROZ82071.1 DUF2946 domain-containing protein [Pseudomonas neustonica]|tara:strand:- start:3994 stop:4398 length:405 start_codon:yes stop_codon:yes gene_type:complete
MPLSRDNRLSVALLLYLCTLFSVLTCGFHQGQMSAQHLSGAGVVFCNTDGQNLGLDLDSAQQHSGDFKPMCPLCSSVGAGIALNSLGWSLDYQPAIAAIPLPPSHWARPPPRAAWPALNPRASPAASGAAVLSA